MSSISTPTVTVTPSNTTASAAGATVSAGQTPQGAQTTPIYTVFAKYADDPRLYGTGTYANMADAQAGLQAQVINGANLMIYQTNVIDRTAG